MVRTNHVTNIYLKDHFDRQLLTEHINRHTHMAGRLHDTTAEAASKSQIQLR